MKRSNVSIWVGSLLGVEKEWWNKPGAEFFHRDGGWVIVSKPLLSVPVITVAPKSFSYRDVILGLTVI